MTIPESGMRNAVRGVTSRMRLVLCALAVAISATAGCRQKMSDQPYGRPLTESDMFEDGRMSRPLERGVIHRGQYLEFDPMVTGLTREEWSRAYAIEAQPKLLEGTPDKWDGSSRAGAVGSPRFFPPAPFKPYDYNDPPPQGTTDPRVAPNREVIYVDEFPFPITDDDLIRGQERYTIYCAVCHGPLGNGEGKLWERRYLKPTSFHTTPVGPQESVEPHEGHWYERAVDRPGQPGFPSAGLPLGYSRNYGIVWRINIPMPEVPIGYYFEIITKGYPGGGMPSYSAQIPPEDRWRIIAYIRVLQLSQRVPAGDLPQAIRDRLNAAGGKK